MKTASKKAKGRRLQNYVAKAVKDKWDIPEQDVRPAIMGENGADLKLSSEAQTLFPFAVECKNTERLNIWAAIKQAEQNARGLSPLVVFKRNHSKTYAVIEFDTFMELLDG